MLLALALLACTGGPAAEPLAPDLPRIRERPALAGHDGDRVVVLGRYTTVDLGPEQRAAVYLLDDHLVLLDDRDPAERRRYDHELVQVLGTLHATAPGLANPLVDPVERVEELR